MKIGIVAVRVLDQDRALQFYTETLGFQVADDLQFGEMRWLTVTSSDPSGVEILLEQPGEPFMDAQSVEANRQLIAKGMAPAVFLETEDVRARFDELVAKGVEVIQEPMERSYGIDAAFRDDSGNHVRLTQRAAR